MRRRLSLAVALLALAGCPETSKTAPPVHPGAPEPTPASASPPAPPSPAAATSQQPEGASAPLDPLYDQLRVGEVYVVHLDYGTPLTSRTEIKARDDDTVTVVTRLERAGSPPVPAEQVLRRRRRPPTPSASAASPSDEKLLRSEKLVVSGIAFDCKVTESVDPVAGKLTSWKSDTRYPGLVKQVDAAGKVVFELVEVQAPK